MARMPRMRLVLVVTALLALLIVPMASARPVSSPSLHSVDGWFGTALRWVEDLAGLRHAGHHGRSGNQASLNQKDGTPPPNSPQGGGCITPDGRPRPLCDL